MDLLERTQLQGPFLVGLASAPLFSQGDQSQTSETCAKAQDEHHDEPPEKPEGLVQELEVLLLDQRLVLGLRGNIEAGAVDSQGLQGDVFSQR